MSDETYYAIKIPARIAPSVITALLKTAAGYPVEQHPRIAEDRVLCVAVAKDLERQFTSDPANDPQRR